MRKLEQHISSLSRNLGRHLLLSGPAYLDGLSERQILLQLYLLLGWTVEHPYDD